MKTEQMRWTQASGWEPAAPNKSGIAAQLVLLFGCTSVFKEQGCLDEIKHAYPNAHLFGCSTGGEICDTQVFDDSLVATAIQFEDTQVESASIKLSKEIGGFQAGQRLAKELDREGLVHVFVLSDGLQVNGGELIAGLAAHLPAHVAITGGLAGDGLRFQETLVFCDGVPQQGVVAALGFYGDRLQVGFAAVGGWDPFGPERLVTRVQGNTLYELDGKSALELYKTYLGDLPVWLIPLSLRIPGRSTPVVRAITSVNEDQQSLTIAGEVAEGVYARFMRGNFDRLVDGAISAARRSYEAQGSASPDLAVIVSCIGRKLVLSQRIEEEVEGVRDVLGERTAMIGFYSYGEIAPLAPGMQCDFHNETMTITTFSEK